MAYLTQESVPMWRDGAAGRALQKSMVDCAAERLFEHGVLDTQGKAVFRSGAEWVAFARLVGGPANRVGSVMERLFDTKDRWTDSVRALHRFAFLTGTCSFVFSGSFVSHCSLFFV